MFDCKLSDRCIIKVKYINSDFNWDLTESVIPLPRLAVCYLLWMRPYESLALPSHTDQGIPVLSSYFPSQWMSCVQENVNILYQYWNEYGHNLWILSCHFTKKGD